MSRSARGSYHTVPSAHIGRRPSFGGLTVDQLFHRGQLIKTVRGSVPVGGQTDPDDLPAGRARLLDAGSGAVAGQRFAHRRRRASLLDDPAAVDPDAGGLPTAASGPQRPPLWWTRPAPPPLTWTSSRSQKIAPMLESSRAHTASAARGLRRTARPVRPGPVRVYPGPCCRLHLVPDRTRTADCARFRVSDEAHLGEIDLSPHPGIAVQHPVTVVRGGRNPHHRSTTADPSRGERHDGWLDRLRN